MPHVTCATVIPRHNRSRGQGTSISARSGTYFSHQPRDLVSDLHIIGYIIGKGIPYTWNRESRIADCDRCFNVTDAPNGHFTGIQESQAFGANRQVTICLLSFRRGSVRSRYSEDADFHGENG